jgi:mycothiol system anti-sigma-R factor
MSDSDAASAAGSRVGSRTSGGHASTDCSEAVLRIFELLDGEMGPADCARIQAHLEECEPCLKEYRLDQALKMVIKRSCGREAAPVELRTSIMHRLTMVHVDVVD